MNDIFLTWWDQAEASMTEELGRRLSSRAGSAYRALGDGVATRVAAHMLGALRRDLGAGQQSAMRTAVAAVVQEIAAQPSTFADLKILATMMRAVVLAALQAAPIDEATRAQIDEWLFQLVLMLAQRFVVERERAFQEQSAQLEVGQLERQLGELSAAYEEKTRLLDLIRHSSTPIAPVYDGILVVPLVGMFDSVRAQLLTERLLAGVAEARAQVVILDVSGVPVFDSEAAYHIVRTSAAVRLLGAGLILVGLSPTLARTIVQLGVDLAGLTTLGTLQAGLAHALALRGLRIVAS